MQWMILTLALVAVGSASVLPRTETCDTSTLDNSTFFYNITTYGTTIADIANATGRAICDIGRYNLMADVGIVPNVGQTILVPPQVCEPDSTTCIIDNTNTTRNCIYGGPRLYYTVSGDTYAKVANRLNITVDSLMGQYNQNISANDILPLGEFLKVPLCDPSECTLLPYKLSTAMVYKDLAEQFDTTVGQMMALSPTYNYSTALFEGSNLPTINLPANCTALSNNITVIE